MKYFMRRNSDTTDTTPHWPNQPIVTDRHKIKRFKANQIVKYMLDLCTQHEIFNLNQSDIMPFTQEDRIQLAQLIGYSVRGFSELPYVSDEAFTAATGEIIA